MMKKYIIGISLTALFAINAVAQDTCSREYTDPLRQSLRQQWAENDEVTRDNEGLADIIATQNNEIKQRRRWLNNTPMPQMQRQIETIMLNADIDRLAIDIRNYNSRKSSITRRYNFLKEKTDNLNEHFAECNAARKNAINSQTEQQKAEACEAKGMNYPCN